MLKIGVLHFLLRATYFALSSPYVSKSTFLLFCLLILLGFSSKILHSDARLCVECREDEWKSGVITDCHVGCVLSSAVRAARPLLFSLEVRVGATRVTVGVHPVTCPCYLLAFRQETEHSVGDRQSL